MNRFMAKRVLFAFLAAAAMAAAAFRGAGAEEQKSVKDIRPPEGGMVPGGGKPDLILVPTGNLNGFLEDCGCAGVKLGGLARRMGYAKMIQEKFPGTPLVFVDAGNFFRDPRRADGRLRSRALVAMFNRMGYAAANAGLVEMGDAAFLESLMKEANFPLLSASWVREDGKEPLLEKPFMSRVLPGGKKIAFLGLYASPGGPWLPLPGGGKAVPLPPVEAAGEWASTAREERDALVLLACADDESIQKVLASVKGIDLVIAASGTESDAEPVMVAGVPVFHVGYEGREFHELRLFFKKDGIRVEGYRTALADWVPVDDEAEFWLEQTLKDLRTRHPEDWSRLSGEPLQRPGQGEGKSLLEMLPKDYAGAQACAACHAEAHKAWSASPHAAAMKTLARSRQQDNPACVGCHSTGRQQGGFVSMKKTPQFAGVQCESCHGPSAGHAANPSAPAGLPLDEARFGCYDCHDKTQSPRFEHEKYMNLIRHWGEGFPEAASAPAAGAESAPASK
jgi:hypothetical protein